MEYKKRRFNKVQTASTLINKIIEIYLSAQSSSSYFSDSRLLAGYNRNRYQIDINFLAMMYNNTLFIIKMLSN